VVRDWPPSLRASSASGDSSPGKIIPRVSGAGVAGPLAAVQLPRLGHRMGGCSTASTMRGPLLTISTASFTVRTSCPDDSGHSTGGTRRAGIFRLAVPRLVPRRRQLIRHADRIRAPGPLTPGRSRPLPAGDRQASASFAADYAQDSGPDPGNGLAAPGEDHPEPTSATGRAGGCQTCTVSVPPRRALAGGRGS
jgi:hypothetical protein